jgi:phage tail-like protein
VIFHLERFQWRERSAVSEYDTREAKGATGMPAKDKEAHVPVSFALKIGGKEATGFDSESEVSEIKRSLPNGRTDVIKAAGNTKWGDIELKRGVDTNRSLWKWRKLVIDGKLETARKDCTITMFDLEGQPVVTYSIINAWPKKYTGVGLKADSNEVAVEGITLCHEGFEIN